MTPKDEDPSIDKLRARVREMEKSQRSLRAAINLVLLAAILVVSSAWYYLFRQTGFTRRVADAAEQRVVVFNEKKLPRYQAFLNQLQGFARTNADFAAILQRHGVATAGVAADPSAPWKNPTLPIAE